VVTPIDQAGRSQLHASRRMAPTGRCGLRADWIHNLRRTFRAVLAGSSTRIRLDEEGQPRVLDLGAVSAESRPVMSQRWGLMAMAAETDSTGAGGAQSRGHKVDAAGGERLHYLGMEFAIRASAESTGGAFSIVEEFYPLDTPLHIHHSHDELFYVLEGEHVFTVGGVELWAGPGDVVFGPRGVPHAHRRVVPRTGRILEMFSPAGFEAFFRELAEADRDRPVGVEDLRRIAAKFSVTFLD
jgi:mannose-6-phosphate isomerase-like protein (cupin superfamily)